MGIAASTKQTIDNPLQSFQQIQTANVAQQLQRQGQYVVQSKVNQSSSNTIVGSSVFVWLEKNPDSTSNRHTARCLREVNTFMEIFTDPAVFENYIRQSPPNTKIVLVVSGSIGKELVPKIHHFSVLESVVIFCFNVEENRAWSAEFAKVKYVVSDNDELIEKLREISVNLENKEEFQSMRIVLPEVPKDQFEIGHRSLFWFQVFLDFLLDSTDLASYQSFADFIKIVKRYVANDKYAEGLLNNFSSEYRPDQAISWFLRDGPFRSLVRRALLEYDIPFLFTLRFFFVDIKHQLRRCEVRSVMAYRYIPMTREEMENIKLHRGQLLVINSFLLASKDLNQIDKTVLKDDSMIPVLFRIKAQKDGNTPPFAILSEEMTLEHIQIKGTEVLFMAGTTFEISSFLFEPSSSVLDLNMIDHKKSQVFKSLTKNFQDQDAASSVSNLLLLCGHRKKAVLFNHKLYSILPATHYSRPLLSKNVKKCILSGHSVCLVLQVDRYHTQFSLALLEMIGRLSENMVFIVSNVDLDHWRSTGRPIHLFTTSEFNSSSFLQKAEDVTSYVLDQTGKDDEKHGLFTSIDRMILHLIDCVLQSYQREMDEWRSIRAVQEIVKVDKKIKEIYENTRLIHLNIYAETPSMKNLKSPVPLLLMLWKSDSDDFHEIKEIFKEKFYDFQTFDDQEKVHQFVVNYQSQLNIFLIIQDCYSQEVADTFLQFPHVKCVLRYTIESDASTTEDKGNEKMSANVAQSPPISKQKDLIFQLAWNLARYYPKMAEEYQSQNMLHEAKAMLIEAKNLGKFLSMTCFQKI